MADTDSTLFTCTTWEGSQSEDTVSLLKLCKIYHDSKYFNEKCALSSLLCLNAKIIKFCPG